MIESQPTELVQIESNPAPDPRNRRRQPRYAVDNPVKVAVLHPAQPARIPGFAVDLSKDGIGIVVGQPFTLGDVVEIVLNSTVIVGEVRYCSQRDGKYRIGVAITKVDMGELCRRTMFPD